MPQSGSRPRVPPLYPQVWWQRPTTSEDATPSARAHRSRICSRGCGRAGGTRGTGRRVFGRGPTRGCACCSGATGRTRGAGRSAGTAGRGARTGAWVWRSGAGAGSGVRRGRSGPIRTSADRPEGGATDTVGAADAGRSGTAGPRTPCGRSSDGAELDVTVAQPVTLNRTRSSRISGRDDTGPLCAGVEPPRWCRAAGSPQRGARVEGG